MLATGIRSKCVTLLIDGPADADPWGKEALLNDGVKVGRLTSGGYSVAFGKQKQIAAHHFTAGDAVLLAMAKHQRTRAG